MAVVASDMSRSEVKQAITAGRVRPMDTMPPLTDVEVDAAFHIVGQLGVEAFRRALEADADVVVLGRACDTGIFACIPAMLGFPAGISMRMAKIIECASLCCVPGGRDTILGMLDDSGFELESMAMNRAATPSSVAAHSLYEQADPYEVREPSGRADLRHVTYRALERGARACKARRSNPATRPTLKLEGATMVGYRALLIAGAADPPFITRHEEILAAVSHVVRDLVCEDADYERKLGVHNQTVKSLAIDNERHRQTSCRRTLPPPGAIENSRNMLCSSLNNARSRLSSICSLALIDHNQWEGLLAEPVGVQRGQA